MLSKWNNWPNAVLRKAYYYQSFMRLAKLRDECWMAIIMQIELPDIGWLKSIILKGLENIDD